MSETSSAEVIDTWNIDRGPELSEFIRRRLGSPALQEVELEVDLEL